MKIYVTLIAVVAFCMASSSCSHHTTCSAYGASIQKIEKNQNELHVSVDNSKEERI